MPDGIKLGNKTMSKMSEEELAKKYEEAKAKLENVKQSFIIEQAKIKKWDHHS